MAARHAPGAAPKSRSAAAHGIRGYFSVASTKPAIAPPTLLRQSERAIRAIHAVAISVPPRSEPCKFVSLISGHVDVPPVHVRSCDIRKGREHSPVTPTGLAIDRSDEDQCPVRAVHPFSTPSPPQSSGGGQASGDTSELEVVSAVTPAVSGPSHSRLCPVKVLDVDEDSLSSRYLVRNPPDEPTITLEPEDVVPNGSEMSGSTGTRKGADNRPSKRARRELADASSGSGQLHPFFARTTAAAASKSGQTKTTRAQSDPNDIRPVDPWSFPRTATVHINRPEAGRSVASPVNSRPDTSPLLLPVWRPPSWSSRVSMDDKPQREDYGVQYVGSSLACGDAMWAEKYRDDMHGTLDVLNSSYVKELTEWLVPFFSRTPSIVDEPCNDGDSSRDDDSDGSSYIYRREDGCGSQDSSVENIVLLTGAIGSGKTTVARLAARSLGLTVIEINAGTCCRSGKRIRDYVGEALVTHRVRNRPPRQSVQRAQDETITQNEGCNSLIIFEEVDELFNDERGFWTSILELAEAAGARRPIVLTANRVSTEMRAVFGPCLTERQNEVSRLISGVLLGSVAPAVELFKRIHIPSPRTKKLYSALRSIAKTERSTLRKSDLRVLTGRSANGDVRGALNALQFWSLCPSDPDGNTPRHPVVSASLHADASDWCAESVTRAQEALWTGDLENPCGHISLVASHFRICGNSGLLRSPTTDSSFNDLSDSSSRDLIAWVEHSESISLADVVASSLRDRCLAKDPRHMDEATGDEYGFGGFVGLRSCATAVEVQSLRVLNDAVDANFPQPDDSADSLSFYYSLAALTSPVSGDLLVDPPKFLPPASSYRTFTSEILPMLRLFATSDLRSRSNKDGGTADCDKPHRLRRRSLRSSIYRNHYDSLGLSVATSSWLQMSSITSKGHTS